MSSPESQSQNQPDTPTEGAGKVALVSFVLASDPTEVVIMELIGSATASIAGRRAVALGGLDNGELYTRVPTMFMRDPVHINRQQILLMAPPTEALVRMHQRFWTWWGDNSKTNELALDKFISTAPNSQDPTPSLDYPITGSRTIH